MDLRNRNVTCLVTIPDSVAFAVDVDRNSDGREVLSKVCDSLHVLETDYFGLVYQGAKGEELWLNLRNPLSAELSSSSPPYRLQLRVKFFTEPHLIQQITTRNQFYLNVKQQFLAGKLGLLSDSDVVNLAALIFHVTLEECTRAFRSSPSAADCLPPEYRSSTWIDLVLGQRSQLSTLNFETAKSRFLQVASTSPFYGIHLHEAMEDGGRVIHVGVGREGVTEYGEEWKPCEKWTWPAVQSATHNAFNVIVNVIQDDDVIVTHALRFQNKQAANALYRDMTEMHSFYHCDTIGSLVAEQYCRDIKGTIVSFFNENTCLGKRYVFDIQRTLQEAYDYARRLLYAAEVRGRQCLAVDERLASVFHIPESGHSCSSSCQAAKQLNEIRESLACHICVDADINTTFVPCGHIVCCSACAKRLDCCPVCKRTIDMVQPVFLPYFRPTFGEASDSLAVACV